MAVYALALAALTLGNLVGPERWWWSSFNLYLPQWLWALPGLALLAVAARFFRRFLWLPLLCLLWVVGPIMGFCWHFGGKAAGTRLRVMTYNVKAGARNRDALLREIQQANPDILVLQEASTRITRRLEAAFPDWNTYRRDQFYVASRHPIFNLELSPRAFPGTSPPALRCQVQIDGTDIAVYSAHLVSPRRGLLMLRWNKAGGINDWEWNVTQRRKQVEVLAEQARSERGPVIVAGDLNAPVQSLICRSLFDAGLRDAFSDSGRGYGYTYGHTQKLRHSYVRIDHILTSNHFAAESCWAGGGAGSDHRPVIADLVLRPTP